MYKEHVYVDDESLNQRHIDEGDSINNNMEVGTGRTYLIFQETDCCVDHRELGDVLARHIVRHEISCSVVINIAQAGVPWSANLQRRIARNCCSVGFFLWIDHL